MKKNFGKKIFALGMCAGMVFSTAACGGGNGGGSTDGSKNLVVQVLQRGYGVQWLYELKDGFEAANPGVSVEIVEAIDASELTTSFNSGAAYNDVDIYFNLNYSGVVQLYKNTYKKFDGFDYGLADLTDLYSMEIPGEGKKFGDKMNASIKEALSYNGNYYGVPWAPGSSGLFYNHAVFSSIFGEDYHTPRTTDE